MEQKQLRSPRGIVSYWVFQNENVDAPCIFFLHGLSADHTMFDQQVPFFSKSYSVIVWDAPAHGLSRPYADFSYGNCAEELRSILDEESYKTAIFVGQSMGGYVIQAFLLKYPERASVFIGIDTCPFGKQYYSKSDLFWLRQVEWMCSCFPHKTLVQSIASSVGTTEYTRKNMEKALSVYSHRELCHLMGMGYRGFLKENADLSISCPTYILVGEKDKTGKVLSYSKAWHDTTGFPLTIIQNAAHNSNTDQPEEVNARIDRFLNNLSLKGKA
ncbi:MAG: alpha/beta hydrolase [Eubacteriales bacterium]|nr:alpha/beta hydrolase [Eubacteriales bacterium]